MALKVVVVGGVAGGGSAAARLRRLDESAEIVMFEKGQYISFANCGLPYYIGEIIRDKDDLLVQTPANMKARFNIDVRVLSEVTAVNRDNKTVEVYDRQNDKKYTESYDKLVLAPGAEPIKPDLPGIDSEKIYTLRDIPDTFRIKEHIDKNKPQRAMIVGAGFIGLEVAENLHHHGIRTTIVELADHVIGPLDYEMAAIVHQHLKFKNVEFYLNDRVVSFADTGSCVRAELSSGRILRTDMVVIGIGVKPDTRLAAGCGLKLGSRGGIWVDEHMRTSDPDIYAVGDAVEVTDMTTGKPALIPLAGPANRQGRMAADNICGRSEAYPGTLGTSIVKLFDITVGITGGNERSLTRSGIDYEKSFTHSASHASYYPGAIPMAVKLLFAPDSGKLFGAQIVGYEGVDKRIDVLAAAIKAGMSVHDLEGLELAYAPPYSSARDPVNIAGYVASNIVKGDCAVFHWDDIPDVNADMTMLLDVRTVKEYERGTIEGAVNIPLDDLRGRLAEIPKDKDIYIFCYIGLRGYIACRILNQNGFAPVKNLSGGYKTWQLAVQKQANEDIYEHDVITRSDEIKPQD